MGASSFSIFPYSTQAIYIYLYRSMGMGQSCPIPIVAIAGVGLWLCQPQHSPSSWHGESQFCSVQLEFWLRQCFSEYICCHLRCWTIFNLYHFFPDLLPYIVVPSIKVLCALMVLWILSYGYHSIIVSVELSGRVLFISQSF